MGAEEDLPPGLADTVTRLAAERDLSWAELADQAQLSRQYLHRLLAGKVRAPSVATLHRLARALRAPAPLLYAYFEPVSFREPSSAQGLWCSASQPGDRVAFVSDHDCPDHSVVWPGQRFTKQWTIQNAGSVPWAGRRMQRCDRDVVLAERLANGALMPLLGLSLHSGRADLPVRDCAPGETATLSVDFIAPGEPCSVASVWRMVDASGRPCFTSRFFLQAIVTVVAVE